MNHWRARWQLPDLVEGALPARQERKVRRHVAECPRCAKALRRLELADGLLRRLPASLVPLTDGPEATARLATLAQWRRPQPARPAYGSPYGPIPAAGALAAAVVVLALAVTASQWSPVVGDMGAGTVVVASATPDSQLYPLTFR